MCVVSMVSGQFQERWPKPQDFPPSDWFGYQELLRKAREYDRIHQQKIVLILLKLNGKEPLRNI